MKRCLENHKLTKKNKLEHGKLNKFLLDKWGALHILGINNEEKVDKREKNM
jgi:hypothetical protein